MGPVESQGQASLQRYQTIQVDLFSNKPGSSFSRIYEKLYNTLNIMETHGIKKFTGCKKPCYRRKYTFLGDEVATTFEHEDFTFSLWSVSNDTLVESEAGCHNLKKSLVAQFRGRGILKAPS